MQPSRLFDPTLEPGWAELHEGEQAFARSRPERRCRDFVAGRAALRQALQAAGWTGDETLLSLPRGGPVLPLGFTASLTHKGGMGMAVAAPLVAGRTVGVDSEVLGERERLAIADKVLRPAERARWAESDRPWPALLEVFSTKEAIYKALHPHVERYVGFEEAEIAENGSIELHLRHGEGPFAVRSELLWRAERLVVVVEVDPLQAS